MSRHSRERSSLYTCPDCRRLVNDFCDRCGTTCDDKRRAFHTHESDD